MPRRTSNLPIPRGLTLCPICGEYRGKVRARDLNWRGSDAEEEIACDKLVGVSCLCSGIRCPRCRGVMIHRPGSNSYMPGGNYILHNPILPAEPLCDDCRRKAGLRFMQQFGRQ